MQAYYYDGDDDAVPWDVRKQKNVRGNGTRVMLKAILITIGILWLIAWLAYFAGMDDDGEDA